MRSKTDWVIGDDKKPIKVGLAPVQRDGLEYEFTVVFDLDSQHNAHCSKDRTTLFDGKVTKIDERVGELLKEWLNN